MAHGREEVVLRLRRRDRPIAGVGQLRDQGPLTIRDLQAVDRVPQVFAEAAQGRQPAIPPLVAVGHPEEEERDPSPLGSQAEDDLPVPRPPIAEIPAQRLAAGDLAELRLARRADEDQLLVADQVEDRRLALEGARLDQGAHRRDRELADVAGGRDRAIDRLLQRHLLGASTQGVLDRPRLLELGDQLRRADVGVGEVIDHRLQLANSAGQRSGIAVGLDACADVLAHR